MWLLCKIGQHDAILVSVRGFPVWPSCLFSVLYQINEVMLRCDRKQSFVLSAKIVFVSTGVVCTWKSVDWNRILKNHLHNHHVIRCEALIKRPDLKFDTGESLIFRSLCIHQKAVIEKIERDGSSIILRQVSKEKGLLLVVRFLSGSTLVQSSG